MHDTTAGEAGGALQDVHPHGWRRWLYATNHKDIGTLYLWFSLIMFMTGGLLALLLRLELFQPGLQFFRPELYNQFVTMHGLVMVFGAINSLVWVNVTFFPMHFLGLAGMPRRYADYAPQFTDFHMLTSVGALLFGLSQVYFLFAIVLPTIRGGRAAAPKPWDGAEGLEWTVPSPAPFHTFDTPPQVK
jgi:heme/copper-type cytochrome/quinol oxidase subunit 1